MFVTMFFAIFCGYPVAFVMGGMALFFALVGSALGGFSMIGLSDVVLGMWGAVAAGRGPYGDGAHPGRPERRGPPGGRHALGDRAAADAGLGLRQAPGHRHHRF